MSPVQIVVLLGAGALVFWLLGGVVLRMGGLVFMAVGALGAMSRPGAEAAPVLLLGCLMWLIGRRHYALRHGACKGPLASRFVGQQGPTAHRFGGSRGRRLRDDRTNHPG